MLNPEISRPPSASVSPSPAHSSASRAGGELILVVDDQEDIRDLLATVLGSHGYRAVLAIDGADAIAVFQRQPDKIAAMITDLHMPHTEGGSLANQLRQLRPNLPILFMSGLNKGLPAASKDPFLLKPFRPAALLEAIDRLLQPHRTVQP